MKGMLWRGFGGREDELAGMFSSFLPNSFVKMTDFVCMWAATIGHWFGNNSSVKKKKFYRDDT